MKRSCWLTCNSLMYETSLIVLVWVEYESSTDAVSVLLRSGGISDEYAREIILCALALCFVYEWRL